MKVIKTVYDLGNAIFKILIKYIKTCFRSIIDIHANIQIDYFLLMLF